MNNSGANQTTLFLQYLSLQQQHKFKECQQHFIAHVFQFSLTKAS
jgi:hypothetical protein